MMQVVAKGMLAGFAATIVLSALMLVKTAIGMMPELNVVKMLTEMSNKMVGTPPTPVVGWALHFLIGTVLWGGLFALVWPRWPGGSPTVQGIVFSILAWLLMMVLVMPMADAGLFGLAIGLGAPVATLVLHIVFGAVLGVVFGKLVRPNESAETPTAARGAESTEQSNEIDRQKS